MTSDTILDGARARWDGLTAELDAGRRTLELRCPPAQAAEVCGWLSEERGCAFAGLFVEEGAEQWELRYVFVSADDGRQVQVRVAAPLGERTFPSVSARVHAADWHEREAEDMFGLIFEGHPRLGDFILHDDVWQEGVEPMRRAFDPDYAIAHRRPREDWRPRRVVEAPGVFVMPVGPVYSGEAESVNFQLETIGEEIIRAFPRLFFKYRAVEKMAEGRDPDGALLLAERFAGTTSFAHALALCRAVEQIADVDAPERAQVLRVFLAELERFRHHLGAIEGVCSSTGLTVAANQMGILEEEALRVSCELTGHRYLFGLAVTGGLSRDLSAEACAAAVCRAADLAARMDVLERMLSRTSSFLDRIEEVGVISAEQARGNGLVGPVARASGVAVDVRRALPYAGYGRFGFDVPCESEGDGFARLRVLFEEARQSVRLMEQAAAALSDGPVRAPCKAGPGAALAAVEAPRGAAYHYLRLDDAGRVLRYHAVTPSFTNWHGLHLSVETYAFQDFPIILATMALSVAENDR